MAETTLATASEKQVWLSKYFQEYVRKSRYLPYMGKDTNSIIIVKYELQQESGKTINIPLITRLKSDGVTGSGVLVGLEESLGNYNCSIKVDWRRNAVEVPKSTSYKTDVNLWGAAKPALQVWEAEKLRDDITKAFIQVCTGDDVTVDWAVATAGNKNSWLAANPDRVLFGASVANYSATYATAIGNVDTAADKCTVSAMSLAKRIAENADPHIRPFMLEDGREFFVAFHGSRTYRDIKLDAAMIAANKDARAREGNGMNNNPLFQDGDLIYDGIIHRKVPELDALCTKVGGWDGAGSGPCDTRPVLLCGAQSVGVAWGQEPQFQTDMDRDYKFRPGVAIEELLGVKKLTYNGVQQGIVTAVFAAAADS